MSKRLAIFLFCFLFILMISGFGFLFFQNQAFMKGYKSIKDEHRTLVDRINRDIKTIDDTAKSLKDDQNAQNAAISSDVLHEVINLAIGERIRNYSQTDDFAVDSVAFFDHGKSPSATIDLIPSDTLKTSYEGKGRFSIDNDILSGLIKKEMSDAESVYSRYKDYYEEVYNTTLPAFSAYKWSIAIDHVKVATMEGNEVYVLNLAN